MGQNLGLVVDQAEGFLKEGRFTDRVAQTELGEQVENAHEEIVDLDWRHGHVAYVRVGKPVQVDVADHVEGEEFEDARVSGLRGAEFVKNILIK